MPSKLVTTDFNSYEDNCIHNTSGFIFKLLYRTFFPFSCTLDMINVAIIEKPLAHCVDSDKYGNG